MISVLVGFLLDWPRVTALGFFFLLGVSFSLVVKVECSVYYDVSDTRWYWFLKFQAQVQD